MKNLVYIFCISMIFSQKVPYFDEKRAMDLLIKQCDFGPRHPGSVGHEKMKIFLKDFLFPLSDSLFVMDEKIKNPLSNKTMNLTNFFARYNIDAPFRFIIMAHWDSREFADRDPILLNRKLPVLGANDGASGVAVILVLAEILNINVEVILPL